MIFEPLQYGLGAIAGIIVGFSLGLFGGGGSILAVPLLVHFVGVPNVHLAIGTSAFSVAVNALTGLASHARRGTVRWKCACLYGATGIIGASIGAVFGKALDGQRLMLLFAGLMMFVSIMMLRTKSSIGHPDASCSSRNAPKVLSFGGATGLVSGFFGIGGGFLIVPGLKVSTGMTTINAIGSSLAIIAALGLTTASSYAFSGLVDWPLALAFVAGGALGSYLGCQFAHHLSKHRSALAVMFSALIFVVAISLAWSSIATLQPS